MRYVMLLAMLVGCAGSNAPPGANGDAGGGNAGNVGGQGGAGGMAEGCASSDTFDRDVSGWSQWGASDYSTAWTSAGVSGGGIMISGVDERAGLIDAGMSKLFTVASGKFSISFNYRATASIGDQFAWGVQVDVAEPTGATLFTEAVTGKNAITYCADNSDRKSASFGTPYQYCTSAAECTMPPYSFCTGTNELGLPADTGWRSYTKDLSGMIPAHSVVNVILHMRVTSAPSVSSLRDADYFDNIRVDTCP